MWKGGLAHGLLNRYRHPSVRERELGMSSRKPVQRLLLAISLSAATAPLAASPLHGQAALQAFQARQVYLQGLLNAAPAKTAASDLILRSGFETVGGNAECASDRDGDGLSDCVETNTGRFIDASDTGTDPDFADTDADGIPDGEEVLGSETGLDLAALGANPLRRDLLVEYDWFDSDYDCGPHSQRPTAAVMQRVAAMFAAAPVTNPDGSTGIHLIQDYGQGGVFSGGNRVEGHDAILPGAIDATFHEIKLGNFAPERLGYFRYVLMPHRYNGGSNSSGFAEVVGDDAIVSLYCLNTEDNVARTIAHEIGHLLGLHHGGFEVCNNKPNYNSLMNYRYQFSGVDAQCDAQGDPMVDDFSRGTLLSLDERALDEPLGVCGSRAIDWNRDGTLQTAISLKLTPNDTDTCGSELRTLEDFDDWANLSFAGLRDFRGELKSVQSHTQCAGAEP